MSCSPSTFVLCSMKDGPRHLKAYLLTTHLMPRQTYRTLSSMCFRRKCGMMLMLGRSGATRSGDIGLIFQLYTHINPHGHILLPNKTKIIMVSLNNVRFSNKSLQALPPGLVAVFAGATSGIGLGTLRQLAMYANGPRVYIIGRSQEKASHIIDKLKKINPMGTFIFVEGQFSLIKDVDRMCQQIEKYESHVDVLCMSAGYLSLRGRQGMSCQKFGLFCLTCGRYFRRSRNRPRTSILFSTTTGH